MAEEKKAAAEEPLKPKPLVETEPVVTEHQVTCGSKTLKYKVTTGFLPLKDPYTDEIQGQVFFVAYTLAGNHTPRERPLMFSFNGGPGSSSVWLHLGTVGPRRAKMLPDGQLPPPPYELVENPDTWLEHTDLVFIDPVGTGFSRPAKPEYEQKYWGIKGDIESVADFIRLFISRNGRWSSPLYIVGESYGTTRAAGLSGLLVDRGIGLAGIVLVSSVLNFQTLDFTKGNDLPYQLFLPTYAATAWYHGRIKERVELRPFLQEVQNWASTVYWLALNEGDRLAPSMKADVAQRLADFTGLSKEFCLHCDLRVVIFEFCKELLRSENRTVGRLDSRIKGIDARTIGQTADHDPSMSAIMPPYTMMLNDYIRRELQFKTDQDYKIFGDVWEKWDWDRKREGFPDTADALREALAKNPYMRVLICSGLYDLATPYYATEYTLSHMRLDESVRGNIEIKEYEAGHMMYIHEDCLGQLKKDLSEWISKR